MTNETKKQSKAPQTKSETKVAVKKNTEATIKKAALKKDLEAQKKAALENLKKKQEATEKQFLARVNNMASSFETVNGWRASACSQRYWSILSTVRRSRLQTQLILLAVRSICSMVSLSASRRSKALRSTKTSSTL